MLSLAHVCDDRYGSDGASVVATGSEGEVIEVSWLPPQHPSASGVAAVVGASPMVVKCTIPSGSKVLIKVTTVGLKAECLAL